MSFITKENFKSELDKAKAYMEQRVADFDSLDDITGAIADDSKTNNKKSPKIVDPTTAASIRRFPKSTVQSMPIIDAVVEGKRDSIPTYLANWLLRERVFNTDTFGRSFLETCWLAAEKGSTYGFCAAVTTFEDDGYGDFGTRLRLVNYNDIFIEPGRSDVNECNFYFVRNWWQKSDVENIVKTGGESWDKGNLKALLESDNDEGTKPSGSQGPENNKRGISDSGIEVVTCYQRGYEAPFYTAIDGEIIRTVKNKSVSGFPRVMFLTIDPDEEQPLGRSRVRLVAPMQRYLDMLTRNAAHAYEINSAPPISVKGRNIKGRIKFEPFAMWDLGSDPNAEIKLHGVDNTTLQQFPSLKQMFSADIQNLLSSPNASISGGSNSAGFSKTQNGVKFQQEMLDIEGNYLQKLMEDFIREYAKNSLDVLLSEYTGEELITADEELAEKMKANFPEYIKDDGTMLVDWNSLKNEDNELLRIKVTVVVGSTREEAEEKQREALQGLITALTQNEEAWSFIPEKTKAMLVNKMIEKSGVEGVNELFINTDGLSEVAKSPEQLTAEQSMAEQAPEMMLKENLTNEGAI